MHWPNVARPPLSVRELARIIGDLDLSYNGSISLIGGVICGATLFPIASRPDKYNVILQFYL